jgi:hypothetical protein
VQTTISKLNAPGASNATYAAEGHGATELAKVSP